MGAKIISLNYRHLEISTLLASAVVLAAAVLILSLTSTGSGTASGPPITGIFRSGTWIADVNHNHDLELADQTFIFGASGDIPIVGNWGNGVTAGVLKPDSNSGKLEWIMDLNASMSLEDSPIDNYSTFGLDTDKPVTGDFNGDGLDEIGIVRPDSVGNLHWFLDLNNSFIWDGCEVDGCPTFGQDGDLPVTGDWNGDGKKKLGVARPGDKGGLEWYLDYNGNNKWDGCLMDKCLSFGQATDQPVIGDWNADRRDDIGITRKINGQLEWNLDRNGNSSWDGCNPDKCFTYGLADDVPVVWPVAANFKPEGNTDGVDNLGFISGWALDPDNSLQSLEIQFFIDGPAGTGKFAGTAVANLARPVVSQFFGFPGNHGYSYYLPSFVRDGRRHKVYAYAIDSQGGANLLIPSSPISIPPLLNGDAQISGMFDGQPIKIKTSSQMAGAISSLTWNGKQFINVLDRGREMQWAASFNFAGDNRIWGECYNPTEAGSAADGLGPASTSILQDIVATDNSLQTLTNMAFWLEPGESCLKSKRSAVKKVLSNHVLNKRVTIGFQDLPNVIEFSGQQQIPVGPNFAAGNFQLISFMPAEFSQFWMYDPGKSEQLLSVSGPDVLSGQMALRAPVIASTTDGKFALGLYTPELPTADHPLSGYGLFKGLNQPGPNNSVTAPFFLFHDEGITPGEMLTHRGYFVIGSVDEVKTTIDQLNQIFAPNIDHVPVGDTDMVTSKGYINGWTLDTDTPSEPISARFYIDGPEGEGLYAGSVPADAPRPDVDTATRFNTPATSGNHGFSFPIPDGFRDGNEHKIYIYGLDSGGKSALLNHSPSSFKLST